MRYCYTLISTLALAAGLFTGTAVAQPETPNPTAAPQAGAEAWPTVLVLGQVRGPRGPLAGAVVKLADFPARPVVSNADGEFVLTAPAAADRLRAVVSYAGLPDETVLLPLHEPYLSLEPWPADEAKGTKLHSPD